MHTTLKFRCQHCDTGLVADHGSAGLPCTCPGCSSQLMVPRTMALVRIDDGDDDLPDLDFDFDDYEVVAEIVPNESLPMTRQVRGGTTPVELRMPANLGSLKVNVDQPTRNAMATTFLGGALVAVGAVLFSMFGLKHKA
jgi:DNA-directed RNA polymerase subunit RPC12/RpoP